MVCHAHTCGTVPRGRRSTCFLLHTTWPWGMLFHSGKETKTEAKHGFFLQVAEINKTWFLFDLVYLQAPETECQDKYSECSPAGLDNLPAQSPLKGMLPPCPTATLFLQVFCSRSTTNMPVNTWHRGLSFELQVKSPSSFKHSKIRNEGVWLQLIVLSEGKTFGQLSPNHKVKSVVCQWWYRRFYAWK